jgi:glycosyltransferase involved in cell wall biosynthesis
MDEQNQPHQPGQPRVLLVTSDREECGIREYGRELIAAAARAGQEIVEFPYTHPEQLLDRLCGGCAGQAGRPDVIHLNHHAALHAAWTPDHIDALQRLGYGVVVTQHDTFETAEIMFERNLPDFRNADFLVVHEAITGIRAVGGVGSKRRGVVSRIAQPVPAHYRGWATRSQPPSRYGLLGLFGFDFPWKGFDVAIKAAKAAGWEVLLISGNLSIERAQALKALHPDGLEVVSRYLPTSEVVQLLSSCHATVFPYANGNSGTSGAVLVGIAARSPVILSPPSVCRQFRDLAGDLQSAGALTWVEPTERQIAEALWEFTKPATWLGAQHRVSELADALSWDRQVQDYLGIYRELERRRRARG